MQEEPLLDASLRRLFWFAGGYVGLYLIAIGILLGLALKG